MPKRILPTATRFAYFRTMVCGRILCIVPAANCQVRRSVQSAVGTRCSASTAVRPPMRERRTAERPPQWRQARCRPTNATALTHCCASTAAHPQQITHPHFQPNAFSAINGPPRAPEIIANKITHLATHARLPHPTQEAARRIRSQTPLGGCRIELLKKSLHETINRQCSDNFCGLGELNEQQFLPYVV